MGWNNFYGGGVRDHLTGLNPTLANIINGSFSRPMYKIKGVFPKFDINRTMPLRPWEIAEINWKDFAQEVGQLQGYGWDFNPMILDDYNAASENIANLENQVSTFNENISTEQQKLAILNDNVSNLNSIINNFAGNEDLSLSNDDSGVNTLGIDPQSAEYKSSNTYSLTLGELNSQLAIATSKVNEEKLTILNLQTQLKEIQSDLSSAQSDFNKQFATLPVDELGLTDAFMHAVYTEFIKRFWGYRIGQSNREYWFTLLNSFLGNELPMMYKAAEVIKNSTDFSTVQWQTGTGNVTATSNQNGELDSRNLSDAVTNGATNSTTNQTATGLAGASNTPQNRMDLNLNDLDFASQVQKQQNTSDNKGQALSQDSSGNSSISNQKQNQSSTNSSSSTNKGQQYQLDPLEVWNKIIIQNGLFFDLFDKAKQFGLFDLTQ